MTKRFLIPTIVLFLFIQILFSFYYSSDIITQNSLLNDYQSKIESLKVKNSDLRKNLSETTSLSYLESHLKIENYFPIIKTLNLE
ncbi:MAG: hypothetical protein Q8P53_01405 [Candidatus Shapirobacteria bacterium]|nr:hypothetical protein [Candidatus Shapirobacteria bacterium]